MNDFTKSELAVIYLAVKRDMIEFAHILKTSPSMIKLHDKLKKMLDEYCEHDSLEDYIKTEKDRITSLTTVEEYDRLKKELSPEDAKFQFGKHCGYFAAICAVHNKIKEVK